MAGSLAIALSLLCRRALPVTRILSTTMHSYGLTASFVCALSGLLLIRDSAGAAV
jgi:hypothetical protein